MAPPSAMEKKRDSRQDHELGGNIASSANATGEEGGPSVVANRESVRISRIGIADDFRPTTPTTSTTPIRSISPVSPLIPGSRAPSPSQIPTPPSPSSSPSPSTPPPQNNYRSSIAKGPAVGLGLGLSLGDDEENSSTDLPFNPNQSRFNRSNSSASSHSSTGSPYQSRISQISFSYPRRSPSAASNPLRPAHPYGLYQQTTFEEPEDPIDDDNVASSSMGMNARPANFNRRRGPDGEELDVIGPDGHAEQLPPYTRYPEAGPSSEKRSQSDPNTSTLPLLNTSVAGPSSSSSPILATATLTSSPIAISTPVTDAAAADAITIVGQSDPFLAMGHVQPQPSPTQSPIMSTTAPVDSNDSRGVPSSASSLVEKKKTVKWRKKGHKKVLCGVIPLWAVLLFAILCIFLAVIAGGVIGGMVSQEQRNSRYVLSIRYERFHHLMPLQ
jgi:hypothetical protein